MRGGGAGAYRVAPAASRGRGLLEALERVGDDRRDDSPAAERERDPDARSNIGATPVVRKALIAGEVDIYVEYTGNAGFFFNVASNPAWKDLQPGYELGSRLDYAANRIVWLTPAKASNACALSVRRDVGLANNLKTMSDFGRW